MIMRRIALVASLLVAAVSGALGFAGPAHAATAAPVGTFNAPATAAAGAPMWVTSVTPCPATPASMVQYVAVWIADQERPGSGQALKVVYGDLKPDGSWRVTISAPSSAPSGATASYFVEARCVLTNPYPDPNATEADQADVPSQDYVVRPLRLTSSGQGSFTGSAPSAVAGSPTTTTTSTTTTSTTSTTSTTTTTISGAGLRTSSVMPNSLPSGYQPKLDGADTGVSLDAQTASGSRDTDEGTGSNAGGFLLFIAVLAGIAAGGWQLNRFTKR